MQEHTEQFEPILTFASESGTAGIARIRAESDTWSFVLEARPHEMAGEADERLRVFRVGSFESIEDALNTLAANGAWVLEQPTAVHPEYCELVLELALRVSAELRLEAARGAEIEGVWRKVCGSES